jgi:type IV pilus assembly protein PilB
MAEDPHAQLAYTADSSRALAEVNRDYEERETIARAAALKLPAIDLRRVSIDVDLFYLVPKERAELARAIPFFRIGKKVKLAVVDPELAETKTLEDELRERGYQLHLVLVSRSGLEEALPQYDTALVKRAESIENTLDEDSLDAFATEVRSIQADREKIIAAAPEAALNYLLVGAMRTHSSDIHLEPYQTSTLVRLRIDGVLQPIITVDPDTGAKLVQAVKHSAHLKLNVADRPQDGRFSFNLNKRMVDVRVSTLPSIHGESVVLRLLDPGRSVRTLAELGLRGHALELVESGARSPHGMILSTGPTGSGKTTTQYALLRELSTPERKVITLEDPVEYRVEGITQSQIDDADQYGFADALRAVLRHDPDVVMVGEIRDLPSAEIAAQAALTGHIVLSTLHTNDAVSAIPRLANMGLPGYVLAPALDTIIAQRLVRRVCDNCRVTAPLSESELATATAIHAGLKELLPDLPPLPAGFAKGQGCEQCSKTGYRGQIGLFEVFRLTRDMESAVLADSAHELFTLARKEGMLTLREDGLLKALDGLTTISEILRVTME